jgi:hypothetical protein
MVVTLDQTNATIVPEFSNGLLWCYISVYYCLAARGAGGDKFMQDLVVSRVPQCCGDKLSRG